MPGTRRNATVSTSSFKALAERAAHLVDHVFPHVPVRQAGAPAARLLRGGVEWVLTVPHRIRYLLAWDHTLCRAVFKDAPPVTRSAANRLPW